MQKNSRTYQQLKILPWSAAREPLLMALEEDAKATRCRYHSHYFSGDGGGPVRAANASGAHQMSKFKCKHSRDDLHMEMIFYNDQLIIYVGYRIPNWHYGNTAQSS